MSPRNFSGDVPMRQTPTVFTRVQDLSRALRSPLFWQKTKDGIIVTYAGTEKTIHIEVDQTRGIATPWLVYKSTYNNVLRTRALAPIDTLQNSFFAPIFGATDTPFDESQWRARVVDATPKAPAITTSVMSAPPPTTPRPSTQQPQAPVRAESPQTKTLGLRDIVHSIRYHMPQYVSEQPIAIDVDGEPSGFFTIIRRGRGRFLMRDLGEDVGIFGQNERTVMRTLANRFELTEDQIRNATYRFATTEERAAYESGEAEDAEAEGIEVVEYEEQEGTENQTPIGQPAETPVTSVETSAPKPKIKKTRAKNHPKKKTRAQEAAKKQRQEAEQYRSVVDSALAFAKTIHHTKDLKGGLDPIFNLGNLKGDNWAKFRGQIQTNPELQPLVRILRLFKASATALNVDTKGKTTQTQRAFFGELGSLIRNINKIKNLAESLPEIKDPFRNAEATEWVGQHAERRMDAYRYFLFSDMSDADFLLRCFFTSKEEWVDVGAGRTPLVEDSLFNVLREWNSNITVHAIDPAYGAHATDADRFGGRTIKEQVPIEYRDRLSDAPAQALPFADGTKDVYLSSFAYDKFNDNTNVGGTEQALREAARVLKPGGEARIIPIRTHALSLPVYKEFFDEIAPPREHATEAVYPPGEYKIVYLRRKHTSPAQNARLIADSNAWKEQHKEYLQKSTTDN